MIVDIMIHIIALTIKNSLYFRKNEYNITMNNLYSYQIDPADLPSTQNVSNGSNTTDSAVHFDVPESK
jgi:hypothetical protein